MPVGLFFLDGIFPLTVLPLVIFFLEHYIDSIHKTFSRPKNNNVRQAALLLQGKKHQ
jgi:hypothetical protein